jgi:hypothetical protein
MVHGHQPLLLTLLAAAIGVAALLLFQPYSADWPGMGYTKPAKRYVQAALEEDSVRLDRLSASDSPVVWVLRMARLHPDTLAHWTGRAQAWAGDRSGDTTEIFLYPADDVCSDRPMRFRFVGSEREARVLSLSSTCLDPES